MNWLLLLSYLAVAVTSWRLVLKLLRPNCRYRQQAAIAVGVLWPCLFIMVIAFLAIDLVELVLAKALRLLPRRWRR